MSTPQDPESPAADPSDTEFLKAFCELLMCSDPWPASAENQTLVKARANALSRAQGFADWVDAYHRL